MSSIRDLPIYLTTSNGREHIIKVFCHLFNKYWGSDPIVNLVGYEQPKMDLPDNFNFISMGEQVGGIQMWSTDLRKFFLEQECDHFIHVLDDQFIAAPVRFDIMQDLYDVMLERDSVRANLGNIREADGRVRDGRVIEIESRDEYDILELDQDAEYRISTAWSIWNKRYYLKYLPPNRNPWEYELVGSTEAYYDGASHLCCDREYPVHRIEGVVAGDIHTFNWEGNTTTAKAGYLPVSESDVLEMTDMGVI